MIGVNNLTKSRIDKNLFKKITKKILKGEKAKINEVSITLVGAARMRKLNKKYKNKNRTTDALTFNQSHEFINSRFEAGEIIICPEVVKKNAKIFNQPFKKELTRVLIHGILHLLGYDHELRMSDRKMKIKEDYYLSLFLK